MKIAKNVLKCYWDQVWVHSVPSLALHTYWHMTWMRSGFVFKSKGDSKVQLKFKNSFGSSANQDERRKNLLGRVFCCGRGRVWNPLLQWKWSETVILRYSHLLINTNEKMHIIVTDYWVYNKCKGVCKGQGNYAKCWIQMNQFTWLKQRGSLGS